MRIQVQYFAALREKRGLSLENVETEAQTAGQLYEDLRRQHGFPLPSSLIKASVNLKLGPMDTKLAEGDEIVFIPPVAGG